jgi:hypothetical protein
MAGARKPTWKNLSRRGDEGPWIVHLPGHRYGEPCDGCLQEKYEATARLRRDRSALLGVTVTDRETGATFRWAARGDRVTTTHATTATEEDRNRLWRDGRDIIGLPRKQSGGPAPGTGVTVDDLVRKTLELRTDANGWPSELEVADAIARDVRQVRRIAKRAPGSEEPWERIILLARARL